MSDLVSRICSFYSKHHISSLAGNRWHVHRILRTISALPKKNHMTVLDVGCGSGLNTALIKARYPDALVFGLDIDQRYLKVWKKLESIFPSLTFVRGDAADIPFPKQYFDVLIMWGVLEHIGENSGLRKKMQEKQEQAISEFSRVLKHTGSLYIHYLPKKFSVDSVIRRIAGIPQHAKTYSDQEITEKLKKHNFGDISITKKHFLPAYCIHANPLLNRFLQNQYIFMDRLDELLLKTPINFLAADYEIIARKVREKN